jgi:UDP-glucose 4-epimerase
VTEERIVLVTGVAGYWGARLAARLLAEPGDEDGICIIGLDREPPAEQVQGLDFIQADVRNPALVDLLRSEEVDTVCHLGFVETVQPSQAAFELNVIGTTNLLNACVAAGVRKVVLRSSTAVYGARPGNPAFLAEDHTLRGSIRWGTTRDLIEIEKFCATYSHRAPQLTVTILRFPSIVGPTADTPMTRFLHDPWAPSLLGFDPMMQIIHEDDVVEALVHAVYNDAPGVSNVAATDVLPLNKIRGLAGKAPVALFHPFAYWGRKRLDRTGQVGERYLPIEPDYLRYRWVADLRRMRDVLGFEPRHSAEETVRGFAAWRDAGHTLAKLAVMARDEEQLRLVVEQRRQARGLQPLAESTPPDVVSPPEPAQTERLDLEQEWRKG